MFQCAALHKTLSMKAGPTSLGSAGPANLPALNPANSPTPSCSAYTGCDLRPADVKRLLPYSDCSLSLACPESERGQGKKKSVN